MDGVGVELGCSQVRDSHMDTVSFETVSQFSWFYGKRERRTSKTSTDVDKIYF